MMTCHHLLTDTPHTVGYLTALSLLGGPVQDTGLGGRGSGLSQPLPLLPQSGQTRETKKGLKGQNYPLEIPNRH